MTVASTGLERGRTILYQMVMYDAPSIQADSSKLGGKLSRKFRMMIRLYAVDVYKRQSVVGLILVVTVNLITKKISPDSGSGLW